MKTTNNEHPDLTAEPYVVTKEIFGQPTDFLFETRREGATITMTVSTVFPQLEFDGNAVRSFPALRYPWKDR
jgi:hypothetical protein